MASPVSSEQAFSSTGITISKWHNRLGPDIAEALQFLKCMYRHDLIFCEDPSAAAEHLLDQNATPSLSKQNESGWNDLLEDNDQDVAMDVELDGDDDDDVFLLDV